MLKLDTLTVINLVVGTGLPMLVAYLSHWNAPSRVKVLLTVLLGAVSSTLTTILEAGSANVNWRYYAGSFVTVFFTAVVAHFGALKGLGVTGPLGSLAHVGLSVGGDGAEPAVKKATKKRARPRGDAGLSELGLIVMATIAAVAVILVILMLTDNLH